MFGGDAAKAALTNAAHPGGTDNVADPAEAIDLPQAATDFEQLMINGGMLLAMVAGGLLLLRRRRQA